VALAVVALPPARARPLNLLVALQLGLQRRLVLAARAGAAAPARALEARGPSTVDEARDRGVADLPLEQEQRRFLAPRSTPPGPARR